MTFISDTLLIAAEALKRGELVAFPTETVYGLGANALDPQAVARIFAAKQRPADHPLIVHLGHVSELQDWAVDIPAEAQHLAEHFWPGPLTLILPRSARVLDCVTGGQSAVGLRVPNHPVALALLQKFGSGIAAPSANRFGRISPTTAQHVREELGEHVDYILEGGECEVGIESTIVDCRTQKLQILRPGAISAEEISQQIGRSVQIVTKGANLRVSGLLRSHYAPTTSLKIIVPSVLQASAKIAVKMHRKIAVMALQANPGLKNIKWIQMPVDPEQYAHNLYAVLRDLDKEGLDQIWVEQVPDISGWIAIQDRLRRAAG